MSFLEHQVLCKLNWGNNNAFPVVFGGGEFIISNQRYSYIVMENLGKTLQHYLYAKNSAFSLKTVCQVGIRLIELLEKIHKLGKVYNDLKLENILVGDQNNSPGSLHEIRLIDFGLVTDYLDPEGNHLLEKQEK